MAEEGRPYSCGNVYNFRSLAETPTAGVRLRGDRLFRGGFFFCRGSEDVEALHARHGITTFLDLRSSDEVPAGFAADVTARGFAYMNAQVIPFWRSFFYMALRVPVSQLLSVLWTLIVALFTLRLGLFVQSIKSTSTTLPLGWFFPVVYTYGMAELRAIFRFLVAHSEEPTVIYCTFGKDRTGLICAMLEMLLGLTLDEALADYELSERSLADHLVVAQEHFKVFGGDPKGVEIARVDRRLIEAFARYVATTYGTVERYFLDGVGLTPQEVSTLRQNYLAC